MHTSTTETIRPARRNRFRTPLVFGLTMALMLAALAGCSSYQPLSPPELALPPGVDYVDQGDYILLAPADQSPSGDRREQDAPIDRGIIFYPGGLVDPTAYVSMLAPLAADGIPVAILRVPADLAVLSPNRARSVLDGDDGTIARTWTLAGHSLGGAMAARFIARNAADYNDDARVKGLILMASYPAASDSLAKSDQPVLSLWAENDGLATAEDRSETSPRLPPETRFATIEGGNHAGFGEYGPQDDDGELEIPRDEQHRQTRELVKEFLADLDDRAP